MRLYWIKDRLTDKEFHIYWSAGENNLADYFTKHFAPSYHLHIIPTYILKNHHMSVSELQSEGVLIYRDITPKGGLNIRPFSSEQYTQCAQYARAQYVHNK